MSKIQNTKSDRFTAPAKSNRIVALKTLTKADKGTLCRLHYKKIRSSINLPALNEVFAGLRNPSILGGNSAKADADRFSCWAAGPKEIFEFRAGQKDPFGKLQRALEKYKLVKGPADDLPKGFFRGGWIGYFSYELGRYIERLPETTIDDLQMPLIRLCFYDRFIAYDHLEGTCFAIALQLPDDSEKPQEKLASLENVFTKARKISVPPPPPADIEHIDFSQIRCNMDKDYYLRMFEKIKRYIYDGDVYQINFSQRFECDYNARPIALFHWQNHYNPSPYAAYIDAGSFHIVSASPEMFITIADGIISTKPIKGTRPRVSEDGQGKQINARNFDELLSSEKEQAELNMIVDLERNDIARICEPGTRKVVQPRTIESYPTVFHAVATVAGRLRKEITFCDILKAIFPGGSITGAPKIRSMEIIDETEPTDRGVYTGGIGYIGLDGSACLNIVIRTIIIKNQMAFAQTGGGIVADSDPQAEWDETITKARALLAGIKATQVAAKL
ncbi:MAG TPA: anthranilate synthase component I family protein [Planctomycetes bacterium]|nr:anthranilate synthase component I family protein [Planctomycetota bacterium]